MAVNIWLFRRVVVMMMMVVVGEVIFALHGLRIWLLGRALACFRLLLLPGLLGEHHFFHLLNGHRSLDIDKFLLDHMLLLELKD